MKVLTRSHGECMQACNEPWIWVNQAGMSKQAGLRIQEEAEEGEARTCGLS